MIESVIEKKKNVFFSQIPDLYLIFDLKFEVVGLNLPLEPNFSLTFLKQSNVKDLSRFGYRHTSKGQRHFEHHNNNDVIIFKPIYEAIHP